MMLRRRGLTGFRSSTNSGCFKLISELNDW